jgi:hypothetical protein
MAVPWTVLLTSQDNGKASDWLGSGRTLKSAVEPLQKMPQGDAGLAGLQ